MVIRATVFFYKQNMQKQTAKTSQNVEVSDHVVLGDQGHGKLHQLLLVPALYSTVLSEAFTMYVHQQLWDAYSGSSVQ